MANPNLVNVTSITGESVQATLDTTLTTEILAAASDTLVKINSIFKCYPIFTSGIKNGPC